MKKIVWLLLIVVVALAFIFYRSRIAKNNPEINGTKNMMEITSSAFVSEGEIPKKYTCDGEDINPPLSIEGVPQNAKSLILILDDPDAPAGNWNHWLIWNINPATKEIAEDSIPESSVLGVTSSGDSEYHGPCPPSGIHRYFFRIYALDSYLNIPSTSKRNDLLNAMSGHIIEEAEYMGKYGKE
jgi:Raf kinase inhibitor-like YbhB/YbcL family protein